MWIIFYNKITLLVKDFFYNIYDRIDFTAFKTNKLGSIGAVVPKKREKDLATLLLRLIVNGKDSLDAILAGIHEGSLRESSLKSYNYGFEEGSQYGGLLHTADFKSAGPGILIPGFTTAWMANSTIFVFIYMTFS